MAKSQVLKDNTSLNALLSSVAVPTNLFDVLGSADGGRVTPVIRLNRYDVLAAAAGPTPAGPVPNGGATTDETGWGLERIPPSRKNLTFFKFMGAWGHQTFTLTANIKPRDPALTGFAVDPRFNGHDIFVQALRTNLNDPQLLDLNTVSGLARSLNVQLGSSAGDKAKVKVTLQRGDVFAIAPDGDKHFRIYTAYTGMFFYFKMEDKGTFRYRISKRGVSGAGDGFSALVAPEVSKQYSFFTPQKYLRPLWGQFDRTSAKINKLINQERRKILVKRNRFVLRLGDVVTGFNGTTENWLVVRQIYNKNIDKNFYMMVLDDNTSFAHRTWSELESITVIQEAPGGTNGLQQLPNIRYVRTLLHANPVNAEERGQTQAFNDIFTALQPKVNEVIRTMALDPLEADIRPQARDMNRELPTNPERDPNNSQLRPGKIIFLTSLPNQITNVMAPASDEDYRVKFEEEKQKIEQSTPDPTQQATLIAELRSRFDNLRKSGVLSQPREITFHDSQGWYLIVRSKPLDNESKIEWTLVPYPAQKRKIRATVPVTVKLEDRRASAPRGPFAPRPQERTATSTKDIYLDYVVLRLDMQGSNELSSLIQHQAVLDAQVQSVQWPKDGNKALRQAEQFVTERDMSGNLRKVKVGDIVNYEDQYFYVANVKRVNKGQQYTIAPLRAFVDLKTSSLEPPFKFSAGGLPAIGYRVITTPAEGGDSFDQKARKVATAYQLQDSGIKELFLRFYSEYEADGRPRSEPLPASRNPMIDEGQGVQPGGAAAVDAEFFSTNKGGKPRTDSPKSAPVTNQMQKIEKDRSSSDRVQRAVESGQLRPGMLITYDWGNNHMTTEIFYEVVDRDRIRLVPHESGDLHSKPDGIVPAKGFFEIYRGPNVPKPGFWDNFNSGFYQSASSAHRFRFAPSFRENFTKILEAAGSVVPKEASVTNSDYIGADDPKEVMSRKRYRDGLFESAVDSAINAMITQYGLDKDAATAGINAAGAPNSGNGTYLGKVIQYVRKDQILRSVIQGGVVSNWVPAQLKELKIYPDSKSGLNTRVLLKDIDKFITPQDVDPAYGKNQQLHEEMQSKFAQFILSNPDPDQDFLDPAVRDYYWTYFGIDLD